MIFITIGTQEPFDRLVKAMDEIALAFPNQEFIAQISNTLYKAKNLKTKTFLEPSEFNKLFEEAELIVSHAGMGTIITALQFGKPIIVMPRKSNLGEHRNDHQMATAKKMDNLGYIHVAYDELELKTLMDKGLDGLPSLHVLGKWASPELVSSLKLLVDNVL